jgi:hypothetical protein
MARSSKARSSRSTGRGPARHRLQVRGCHPQPRAVDPQRRRPLRGRQGRRRGRGPRPPEGGQGRPPDPVQEARPVRARLGHIEKIKEEDGVVRPGHRGRQGRPDHRHRPARLPARIPGRDCAGSATSQPYVGKEIEAKIIELDKNRNNVVLSRRAWLEETQKEQREEFLENLKGEVRKGVVSSSSTSVRSSTSAAWTASSTCPSCPGSTSTTPSEVVSRRRRGHRRGARGRPRPRAHLLSLKATQQDPWQEFARTHRVGELVYGRVTKLVPVRCVRPGGRRHRGPGAHLRDVGAPRRPARAGRHPGRELWVKIIDLDLAASPDQPVDQAGCRGWRRGRRVPGALRRARLRRRGQLHRFETLSCEVGRADRESSSVGPIRDRRFHSTQGVSR